MLDLNFIAENMRRQRKRNGGQGIGIPLHCFTKPTWFNGIKGKEKYNPHGRARIQRSSAIFAAIVDYTCEKVMRDLLGSENALLSSPESPVEGRNPFRRM